MGKDGIIGHVNIRMKYIYEIVKHIPNVACTWRHSISSMFDLALIKYLQKEFIDNGYQGIWFWPREHWISWMWLMGSGNATITKNAIICNMNNIQHVNGSTKDIKNNVVGSLDGAYPWKEPTKVRYQEDC